MKKLIPLSEDFWWTGVQEEHVTSPIAYCSWDDICMPTELGGLGIRDLETVNKSLIIESAWNVATNKNPFLSAILKAKYYPNDSFWNAPNTGSRSIYWSSVSQVKHHLTSNAIFQIHAGNSSIWSTPWTPIWNQIHDHLILPVINPPLPAKISDLWVPGTHNWDLQILSSTFSDQAAHSIAETPIVDSDQEDILRWLPARDGKCTTKAVYNHLASQQVHQLSNQGSRSISHDANLILQKAWKSKIIPPLLKTFAWRLIRHAIATGERAGRYSTHIDQQCSYCGAIENDLHLFFHCSLSSEVWSSANPPIFANNIPAEEDGIQSALPLLITPNPSDDSLCKFLFILWYIWKARNDNRFQRRTWTAFQVHQAAKAHMHTHLSALRDNGDNSQDHSTTTLNPATTPGHIHDDTATTAASQGLPSFAGNQGPQQQEAAAPSTNISLAGINQVSLQGNILSTAAMDRFLVPFPTLLQGTRCYTDASTQPDLAASVPREAGIGIFIVNTEMQPPLSMFIKAAMQDSSSVLMAE